MNLPEKFTERIGRQLGDGLSAFLRAMEEEPTRGIRLNPLRAWDGKDTFIAGMERIPWCAEGYYLPADSKAGATVAHEAGAFYLQDPGAMIPAEALDPKPGERILDLCAAPGGKSTQIGLKMAGQGLLVTNEPVPKRALILAGNVERMGIPNALVTCAYPERLAEKWEGTFDGVLADVPCSGEGMFRKDPETRAEWTPERAAGCAERQREILEEAAGLVCPGGRLVYSTCTFNPAENEEQIDAFLTGHPEFCAEAFELPGLKVENGRLTCWPHLYRGEGQFVAKLRKTGEPGNRVCPPNAKPALNRDEGKLWENKGLTLPEPTHRLGETLCRLEGCPDIGGIRVFRMGLHLGQFKGKTFIPDHASAMAFSMRGRFPEKALTAEEALKYLAGESVPGEEKGWMTVTYEGLPLGWGKGSDGQIKNHYPKGLRKQHLMTEDDHDSEYRV